LPAANHFNLEIEHFSDCVLNDKQPRLSLTDAKANCAAIEACLKSIVTQAVSIVKKIR
jgi:predicted dehydrogenase